MGKPSVAESAKYLCIKKYHFMPEKLTYYQVIQKRSLYVAKLLTLFFTFYRLDTTLLPNTILTVGMSNRRQDVD